MHIEPSEKDIRSSGEHAVTDGAPLTSSEAHWRAHAQAWEGVARNMAQVLSNTVQWIEDCGTRHFTKAECDALRDTFRAQCAAHQVTP